jgi:TIR domain-containing protein
MTLDFFISYASPDREWAEWVGWVLEESGASVVLQAWDFRPGSNFVLEMQRAAAARRTIAILSPDYLVSQFAAPEWAVAFAQDPEGIKRSLVPVRVRYCALEGMVKTIVHIDLVGHDEAAARKELLDGVCETRAKPTRAPAFPGGTEAGHRIVASPPPFPGFAKTSGRAEGGQVRTAPYMPTVRRAISDFDRTRFIKQAFETVRDHFGSGLEELARQPSIDVDFTRVTKTEFTAQAFVGGKNRARCRIWLGGGFGGGNQISYYEGDFDRGNALNEALRIADDPCELALSALMKMHFGPGRAAEGINLERMSADEAAEYLWRRFVSALE